MGGSLCQDVAIYFSFDSKINFAENGKRVPSFDEPQWGAEMPHVEAAVGAAESLRTNHIPFGVITKKNLDELSSHQVIVLPDVLMLSDREVDAIGKYISAGGCVYASRFSMRSKLSKMLDVTSLEETPEKVTYIAPTSKGQTILSEVTKKYPLSIQDSQLKANFSSRTVVLGTIALPYTNPADTSKFVSIASNPPMVATEYPAVILKEIGKGKVVWSSAPIEKFALQSLRHRSIFTRIIKSLAQRPFSFEATAPACVEILQFHKRDEKRNVVNLVNYQSEIGIPNIPIDGIILKVKVNGKPSRVSLLPDDKPIPFDCIGEFVKVKVPTLHTFLMLAFDYE